MPQKIKLSVIIKSFGDNSTNRIKIQLCRFNAVAKGIYKKKMKMLNDDIDAKMQLYGLESSEVEEFKSHMNEKYDAEFQRIYDNRKGQFKDLLVEIGELEAIKSISLVNYLKMTKDRSDYMKSNECILYNSEKEDIENIIKASEGDQKRAFIDKLNALEDPLYKYDRKCTALLNRYNNCNSVIEEINAQFNDCIKAMSDDFDEVLKVDTSLEKISKEKFGMNFIKKLLFKLLKLGKNRFRADVVPEFEKNIKEVNSRNSDMEEIIDIQTKNILYKIDNMKDAINNRYTRDTTI